jgi:hypothetical protein
MSCISCVEETIGKAYTDAERTRRGEIYDLRCIGHGEFDDAAVGILLHITINISDFIVPQKRFN